MKRTSRIETKSLELATDYAFTEAKFSAGAAEGSFAGYGAVFGNVDAHGDMIMPGAFAESLAERKAASRPVPMHLMHRIFGGDGLPVGVWTKVEEDAKGLKVEGKISGMNTDAGRRVFELVRDGALAGLSIGYKVRTNGASYGKKAGEPKRTLKSVSLHEISLVDDPSNALTRVDEIKAALAAKAVGDDFSPDAAAASERLKDAIFLQDKLLQNSGGYCWNLKDAALLMDALRDSYEKLTGSRNPPGLEGWKITPTEREFERILRDAGASHSQARAIAERGFKAAFRPREEGDGQAADAAKAFLRELAAKFEA